MHWAAHSFTRQYGNAGQAPPLRSAIGPVVHEATLTLLASTKYHISPILRAFPNRR